MAQAKPKKRVMRELDVSLIDPPTVDLRERIDSEAIDELAESLNGYYMLNPVIVCTVVGSKRFELVAGARRVRAAQRASHKTVPAYIYDGLDRGQRIKMALVENVHREDLEPMWEARAYRILQEEEGLTEEQIAQAIFKRSSHIRNRLKLLGLAPKVQKMVEKGELPVKTAELIAKADPQAQEPLAERIKDSVLDPATLRRMIKNDEIEAARKRRLERERKRQQEEERARRAQEKSKPVPPVRQPSTSTTGKGASVTVSGPAAPATPKKPASPPSPPPKKPVNHHLLPPGHQDDLLRVITRKCDDFVRDFLHGIDLRQFDQQHVRDLHALIFAVERELNLFGQKISQHQTE